MILSVLVFVVLTIILRATVGSLLVAGFQYEVISKTWILPYLNMAAPDLVFFFLCGLVFPFAVRRYNLFVSSLLAGTGLLLGQVTLVQLYSSYVVNDPYGYLVLTAPFFGTVVGFALGVSVSALIFRQLRKADLPRGAA